MRLDDRLEALAPHVEARWREKFITEAGLQGTSATAFSDAGGERSQVSAGLVLSAAVFITSMVVVARFAREVLRLAVGHRVWFTLGFMVAVTATALIGVPFSDVILASVPAGPTLAVGIAAVAASIVWNVLAIRAGAKSDDPLAPPRLDSDTGDRR